MVSGRLVSVSLKENGLSLLPCLMEVFLQPTGKPVSLKIATIARWENGRIAEEYLFWDNADWNRQIGLGQ